VMIVSLSRQLVTLESTCEGAEYSPLYGRSSAAHDSQVAAGRKTC
jgi:hypothetical protein